MSYVKILIIALLSFSSCGYAQQRDSLYHVTVDAGFGYSRYLSALSDGNFNSNGFAALLRLNWHPEYLMKVSLESGYQYLYRYKSNISDTLYGISEVSVSMVSIPIFISFSMKIFPKTLPNLELSYGAGIFLMFTTIKDMTGKIDNIQFSSGTLLGASYIQPLNKSISIGGEFKFMDLEKTNDSDISLHFIFRYRLYSY